MDEESCGLLSTYQSYLEGTYIINGGSIIASPDVYQHLGGYILDRWKGCNDQVALNILVRANMMGKAKVKISRQGVGVMNVLGWGGKVIVDSKGQYLNRNCLVSPVVHQYDIAGS